MFNKSIGVIMLATTILAGSAVAAPMGVDGTISPGEYTNPPAVITYDPTAPESNFSAPTPLSDAVGYDIYTKSSNGYVYVVLQAQPSLGGNIVGTFANLYFDLDPQNNNGSDLGFEINNNGTSNAFIPGVSGSVPVPEVVTAASNGTTLELAIPTTDFTGPITGLNYYDGQVFPNNGDQIVLRLSQSFGYSVNGGALYGPDRLGAVNIDDGTNNVPEPASIILLGAGLISIGAIRKLRLN